MLYRQSERSKEGIYHKYIQELLDKGIAYKDYSTEEELAEMREWQKLTMNRLIMMVVGMVRGRRTKGS